MKKTIIGAALAIAPFVAFAESNTVTFKGEVNAQTCAMGVNGQTAGASVMLPTAKASDLATAGSTTGQAEFTVGVTGCTAPTDDTPQKMSTKFVGSNGITANGNLVNTGGATGVSLQLLNLQSGTAEAIKLTAAGAEVPGLELKKGEDSAQQTFGVRYYAEAAGSKTGTVVGAVQYAIAYK